jgi:hypothetical protein
VQPALRNVEFYLKKGNNIKYEFVNVQRIQFKHSGGDFFYAKKNDTSVNTYRAFK